MGRVFFAPKGDAVYSSELTARAENVMSGSLYVGKDTDDEVGTGTLALTGDASESDVVKGKTFYNTNPQQKQTGTLSLTGDASASDVVNGKTFYATNPQQKVTGTLALSGNAGTGDVVNGKTFYTTDPKQKITGTLELTGNAGESDVVNGKTFYTTSPQQKQTGTLSLTGNATAGNVLKGKTFYNTNPKQKVTGSISVTSPSGDVINSGTASSISVPAHKAIAVLATVRSSGTNYPSFSITYPEDSGFYDVQSTRWGTCGIYLCFISNTTDTEQSVFYTYSGSATLSILKMS